MTDTNTTTQQISAFVARWMTDNDGENLEGETEDCTGRLREALGAAFPKASKSEVDAALQAIRDVFLPVGRLATTNLRKRPLPSDLLGNNDYPLRPARSSLTVG